MIDTSQSTPERVDAQRHLESLLLAARDHQATPDASARRVADVQRWSEVQRERDAAARTRLWGWTLGTSFAVAALLLWLLPWRTTHVSQPSPTEVQVSRAPTPIAAQGASPVQVGERVALAVSPDAEYAVAAADANTTIIQVSRGSVTARLYPDAEHEHQLLLRAKDLQVRATGTVFTVGVGADGQAYSVVHEGSVAATHGMSHIELGSGQAYPEDAPRPPRLVDAAERLSSYALPAPPVQTPAPAPSDKPSVEANVEPKAEPVQLWRQARALRSTGKPTQAIEVLKTLQRLGSATWTPLAHLEIARIYDSDLSDPAQALQQSRSFVKKYKNHALTPEALEMVCQELAQLGRSDAALCR